MFFSLLIEFMAVLTSRFKANTFLPVDLNVIDENFSQLTCICRPMGVVLHNVRSNPCAMSQMLKRNDEVFIVNF